ILWSYWRGAPPRLGIVCGVLKAIGIAALILCLLEPLWSGQRARPGANLYAILADNSQSLKVRDNGQAQSRAGMLQTLLEPHNSDWQAALEDNFEVRRFFFDTQL